MNTRKVLVEIATTERRLPAGTEFVDFVVTLNPLSAPSGAAIVNASPETSVVISAVPVGLYEVRVFARDKQGVAIGDIVTAKLEVPDVGTGTGPGPERFYRAPTGLNFMVS